MQEQIAILQNDHGELASLDDVVRISIVEETKGFAVIKEFEIHNSMNSPEDMRVFVEDMIEKLDHCRILLGKLMTGIFFHSMTKRGYTLLEADSYDEELLQQIVSDLKKKVTNQEKESLPEISKHPMMLDEEGNFFLDLYQVQKRYPELSSKKILLPFFHYELFLTLTIVCSHVMPWLDVYCEEHNLSYVTTREDGFYKVIVEHKGCKGELVTRYGKLRGYQSEVCDTNHQLQEVMLTKRNEIITPFGKFIPKYQVTQARDKFRNSLVFYSNGNLKSIYLEERVGINTSIGRITAEFLTFYETGEIHRVFPRYGQINGFWSEEEEYLQEPQYEIELAPCRIKNKVTSFSFYPTGELAALTVLSSERLEITTSVGKFQGRHGLALHKNGRLKSMEPARPRRITSFLGDVTVYDTQAVGIHADTNSLQFDEDGKLTRMAVIAETIHVSGNSNEFEFSPSLITSQLDLDKKEIIPLYITNSLETIIIKDVTKKESQFLKNEYEFEVKPYLEYYSNLATMDLSCAGDCSSCSNCSKGRYDG